MVANHFRSSLRSPTTTKIQPISNYMVMTATALSQIERIGASQRRSLLAITERFEASIALIFGLNIAMTPGTCTNTNIRQQKNSVALYSTTVALIRSNSLPLLSLGQDVSCGITNNASNSSHLEDAASTGALGWIRLTVCKDLEEKTWRAS